MTIYQKMLLLPLLSLVLYSGFILYSYSANQRNNENIERIRDDYLPLLDAVNENIGLFNQLSSTFKDAVVAGEREWIYSNLELKNKIDKNLAIIENYPHILEPQRTVELRDNFGRYYNNARALSLALLKDRGGYWSDEELVEKVELFHQRANKGFKGLKYDIQAGFKNTVNRTHQDQSQLILMGSGIAVALLVGLASVGLATSWSIRRKLLSVNRGMQTLAIGGADFSRRLEKTSDDELGTLVHWFNQLSDKLEQDYKNIEHLSITDKLTGLNNRLRTDIFLEECIDEAKSRDTALSVILLDIDHFKSINDKFGHLEGDNVLISVADTLKSAVDPSDFIGRWGGEEFILVLPGKSPVTVRNQAESLRATVENTAIPRVGSITASFGIGIFSNGEDRDSLIKRADIALYNAKRGGRNQVATR